MPVLVGSATVVEGTRYTIDELARATGTTARTIRSYQDRGLLPPPVIVGRTGQYDGDHVTRLRVIARLLDERFSLASIAALLHAWETGESLAHILGFVDDVDPGRDRSRSSSRDRVATAELVAAGVPVDVVLAEIARLQADCERIAARFATMVETHAAATGATHESHQGQPGDQGDESHQGHQSSRSRDLVAALPGEVRFLLEDALAARATAASGAAERAGSGTDDRTNELALGAIDLTGNAVFADLGPDGRMASPHGDPTPRRTP